MPGFLAFMGLALVVALAPGPDSLLTLRNTVLGGRRHGFWTAAGVTVSGAIQGMAAALGLGAIIVASQPVFDAIRWAGVAYLAYLGVTAWWAVTRGNGHWKRPDDGAAPAREARNAFRQGFLCNITNPKVLVFNLSVLPQFAGHGAAWYSLVGYALTLVVFGVFVLGGIVLAAGKASQLLARRRAKKVVDAVTGTAMLGFAAALATEH